MVTLDDLAVLGSCPISLNLPYITLFFVMLPVMTPSALRPVDPLCMAISRPLKSPQLLLLLLLLLVLLVSRVMML